MKPPVYVTLITLRAGMTLFEFMDIDANQASGPFLEHLLSLFPLDWTETPEKPYSLSVLPRCETLVGRLV